MLHGVPQVQLLDKVVRARCVHDKCPDPDRRAVQKTVKNQQLQFLFKVVIIPVGPQRQVSMVSLFSRPRRFSCCSTLTRCSTIWLCSPAGSSGAVVERRRFRSHSCTSFSGAGRGEDGRDPTVATSMLDTLLTCLSFRNDRCRGWSRQCSKLWSLRWLGFLGPCTGTRPG